MKNTHKKFLKEVANEMHIPPKDLLTLWDADTPHFGGSWPHRYDDQNKSVGRFCVYCGRPEDYEKGKNYE